MKKAVVTFLTAASLAITIAMAVGTAPALAADCLNNRGIQDAIASGEIAPVAVVLANNGVGGDEEVLSVKVCDQGGGLVYVVAVLGPDGDARNLVLPASN